MRLGSIKLTQIQNLNYSGLGGWPAGLIGNIDHLNPFEVEVEVELGKHNPSIWKIKET